MYNTVSPMIHVEGMPVTGGGVCSGASHLPNSLIYKKVPQIAVCEQRSLKNWEFYVFLDKEMAQNSGKGPLLSDLHPLR